MFDLCACPPLLAILRGPHGVWTMEERGLAALTSEVCGEVTSHKAPAKRTEAGALEMQFSAEALEDIGEVVEDSQTLPAPEPDPAETQE